MSVCLSLARYVCMFVCVCLFLTYRVILARKGKLVTQVLKEGRALVVLKGPTVVQDIRATRYWRAGGGGRGLGVSLVQGIMCCMYVSVGY